jgi:hypothetical protein
MGSCRKKEGYWVQKWRSTSSGGATKSEKVANCRKEKMVKSKGDKIPLPLMSKGENKVKWGDLQKEKIEADWGSIIIE